MRRVVYLSRKRLVVGLTTLTVALAGCGSDSTGTNGTLTQEQADMVGASVSDDIETSISVITAGAGVPTSALRVPRQAAAAGTGCPSSVTPNPPTDSDGDGIPTTATFTFTLPACEFTDVRGATLDITGSVTILDSRPSIPGFDFAASLDNLKFSFTSSNASRTFVATRNGNFTISVGSQGALQTHNWTTQWQATGTPVNTLHSSWTGQFTPDDGGAIVAGEPLPSGVFTANGALDWSAASAGFTFSLHTDVPLQYDPSCASQVGNFSLIRAGQVRAIVAGKSVSGAAVQILWADCGIATVTLIPGVS